MKLARSFLIYFFTFFFNAALSFFTFSVTTHYLSESDLGIIYLYSSFGIFLVPFISVGIQFVLSVDYFILTPEPYRKHFSNGVLIPIITTIFFTLLFLVLYYPLRSLIPVNFFFVIVMPFFCFLIVMNEVVVSLIRNKEKTVLFAGYNVGKNLLEIGLTLLFVAGIGMNWQGRLASAVLSILVAGIALVFIIKRWNLWSTDLDKNEVKKIAIVGLPFIPERLAIFVLAYSAGFFINHYKGINDVGYYSAGAQVAVVVNVSILTLISLFHPYIFKNLSAEKISYSNLKKATFAFIGISLFITIAIIIAAPFIFKWFIGPNFQKGSIYAQYLSIGYFFWSVYAVFLAYLLFIKKNKLIMFISIFGMGLSLLLNLFNVKYFGAIGATYTSMIVYLAMALLMIYFVNRHFKLKMILFS